MGIPDGCHRMNNLFFKSQVVVPVYEKMIKLFLFSGDQMCDKMAISAHTCILKTVEKFEPSPIFSTNKQYVKIKLMQNETNHW